MATNRSSLDSISKAIHDTIIQELVDSMGTAIRDALVDVEQRLRTVITQEVESRMNSLVHSHEAELHRVRDSYVKSLEHVVNNIPTPVINVEQPKVNVSIPQDAIAVRVEHQLNLPNKKTKTEKSVLYGPTGRPEKIVEETTEE